MASAARSSATSRAVRRRARRCSSTGRRPVVPGVLGAGVTGRPGRRCGVRGWGGQRCPGGWRWSCRLLRNVVGWRQRRWWRPNPHLSHRIDRDTCRKRPSRQDRDRMVDGSISRWKTLQVGGQLVGYSYVISREVLTQARRAPHDVAMSPSQPLLVRRRHVDFRRVASAVCRPV
ncbi:putative leader peptide [Streptomyces sp. MB09-01]|uniref:putative leader peptide n=1 Tax=Streptomyces sp. MB09-01 TaxID=3028666 RepID=UPI003A5C75B1